MIQETGTAGDRSRPARSGSAARGAHRRQRCRSRPLEPGRHASLRARIDHRQVQGRRDPRRRSARRPRRWRGRSPIDRHGPTSTSSTSRPTSIRKRPPPRCARGLMSNTRSRAIATTRWRGPTTRSTAINGTSPPSTWSARGTSSPARRPTSSSPCSTAAWRSESGTVRYNSRFSFRLTPNGPVYPALGVVDVPFAAAPELGASGSTRFVVAARFHLERRSAGRSRRARHARRRHDRTAHEQRQRHGRHGLQRAADAGESDSGPVGRDLRQPLRGHRRRRRARRSLCRRQRREGDQPEHRPRRRRRRHRGDRCDPICDRPRLLRRRRVGQHARGRQSARIGSRSRAPDIAGMVAVGAVGRTLDCAFYSTTGPYVELSAPGGDQRQGGTSAGILQQTLDLDCSKPIRGRSRSTGRRAPIRSPTSTSRARRWRRRTSRVSPRC